MISKHALQQYIDGIKDLSMREEGIAKSFADLNEDNYIIGVVPLSYKQAVETLLIETMGQEQFSTLMWWIYDCNYGTDYTTIWDSATNGVIAEVNSVDALYDYLEKM